MKKVHILSKDIVSKIAAGEVIERPASVVKELLENSLDAGASSCELHLSNAGKTLIHIKDTGTGIAEEDLETIFHRHATSKIVSADDLWDIHSLGFRGEALYSIAAIADISLRSRTQEQETGWEIHLRGGEKQDLRPVTCPAGTEIEVKELFYNTPARRKFLKSNVTEMNQILNVFIPYCLLYPERRFLLTHQGKTTLTLAEAKSFPARIAGTLNLDARHMIEFRQDYPDKNLSVHMILGDINIVRSRRDLQFIFINGRPVQNKQITFHVNDVYRLILPPRNYPFFTLFITLPGRDVDANIHPTKREVKIKDEEKLASLIRHLTEQALMTGGQAKQADAPVPQGHSEDLSITAAEKEALSSPLLEQEAQKSVQDTVKKALSRTHAEEMTFDGNLPAEIFESPASDSGPAQPTEQYSFPKQGHFSIAGETLFQKGKETLQSKLERARYIGVFMNKFLLFEFEKSLLVIDQHAAQERITFELFIQQMEKSSIEVQQLLTPYLIKLTPQDLLHWEQTQETLASIGFENTQFDDETIAVHTYPVLLKDPDKAVRDILAGEPVARVDHETIARRACRASIMAGDSLNAKQADFQREQLIKCRDPFTCPHGRPTVIEMSEVFLDKQFLRK